MGFVDTNKMKLSMRQNSLKNALYQAFKGEKYLKRSVLMAIARKMRHRESNAERRLRELCHERLITRELDGNFISGYFNIKIK
jgi:hypothetical protein